MNLTGLAPLSSCPNGSIQVWSVRTQEGLLRIVFGEQKVVCGFGEATATDALGNREVSSLIGMAL